MAGQGAYGDRLREAFRVSAAPAFINRTIAKASIAVTEIRCEASDTGLSAPLPAEDSVLMVLQMRDVPGHDMFLGDRQIHTRYLPSGTLNIYDLRTAPVANSRSPFHHVSLYVPRSALNMIAEQEEIALVDEFDHDPGTGESDEIFSSIAQSLIPSFRDPSKANRLFVDHMTIAAASHAAKKYGNRSRRAASRGFLLSAREQRIVGELLAEHTDGDLTLADVALACGIPSLQLVEAFERTTARSIHSWVRSLVDDRKHPD